MKGSGHTAFRCIICAGIVAFAEFLAGAEAACGQGLYNGSSLYIDGVNVYVDGDIRNSGNLENHGLLALTRDWESRGTYAGQGTLEVYGNTPQKIYHFNQTVHNLVVDGWGQKYIKGSINITNEFHLRQGIIEVSPQDALKLKQGVAIFGGNTDSYVDGAVTVNGAGYKFFPVGKNGTYAPIEFLNVKGESLEFSVEAFENGPLVTVENVIVKKGLYWHRKDLTGTFGGSAVSIGFDRSYFADPDDIVLVAGADWESPFIAISDVLQSNETHKISTRSDILAPILMLGEISEQWTEADFYFSTALSPNALHAENRNVKIFGERLAAEQFRFQVFDRWGAIVYESTSLQNMANSGWDGRNMHGRDLVSGTYPYRLTGVDKTGGKFEKKGVITIVY